MVRNKEKQKIVARRKSLKRLYKLTMDEYDRMYNEQQGCCFICGRHQSEFKIRLGVDHDHKTGNIRKLLCQLCNSNLARYGENIKIFENFVSYLKKEG